MSKQKSFNSLDSLGGLVFSTDPDFKLQADAEPVDSLPAARQVLRIWLERVKGGKEATVIKGFEGPDDALAELAKTLKNKCAAGGNAKDGVIIIQGNHRDKVLKLLLDMGFKNTKNAGG
ncbi:MAG: translation initiation factor [Saprospiraceae bacterium]|nr:translation initiation factor [Saprospiraceae bacterium]